MRLGGKTMVPDPDNARQLIEQGRLSLSKVVNSIVRLIVAILKSLSAPIVQ